MNLAIIDGRSLVFVAVIIGVWVWYFLAGDTDGN
jgi:hypothetical protein